MEPVDRHNSSWLTQFNIPLAAGYSQKWDVFISHRGADSSTNTNIKKTFVSFLHARLEQAGITSFMDEKSLKPGDSAWKLMRDAVRRCSIAIPVLTESYGNSEWCLEELALMFQAPGVAVMPLFLDDDVGTVLQKIKDASARLKSRVSESTFDTWQQAIERVGARTGWRQDQMSG